MILVSKLWMTFSLANLRPKSHPSDLPFEECHLLGCIKTPNITVDTAWIISDMIWANVHKGGTKQSLTFRSLITSLCEDAGVPVVCSQKIREPIDKKYFRNNYTDRDPNAPAAPPLQVPPRTMEDLRGRISTRLDHNDKQFSALHRGLTSLHLSYYSMAQQSMSGQTLFQPPDAFAAHMAWPGDQPIPPGEAAGEGGEGNSGRGEDDGSDGDGDIDINDYLEEDDPLI
jgi:hypothetical protein